MQYNPSAEGPLSGTLTVYSNADNAPHAVTLSGSGVDPYAAGLTLLLQGDSYPVSDSSPAARSIVAHGNATVTTTLKVAGTGAMYFDGSGDYLTSPANTCLVFGTEDFTVESWVYLTKFTPYAAIAGVWNGSVGGSSWLVTQESSDSSNLRFGYSTGAAVTFVETSGGLAYNRWIHVAATRKNGTLRLFIDGALRHTSTAPAFNQANVNLGVMSISTGEFTSAGYVDGLRITKGGARYTGNFTPATSY